MGIDIIERLCYHISVSRGVEDIPCSNFVNTEKSRNCIKFWDFGIYVWKIFIQAYMLKFFLLYIKLLWYLHSVVTISLNMLHLTQTINYFPVFWKTLINKIKHNKLDGDKYSSVRLFIWSHTKIILRLITQKRRQNIWKN